MYVMPITNFPRFVCGSTARKVLIKAVYNFMFDISFHDMATPASPSFSVSLVDVADKDLYQLIDLRTVSID